MWSTRPRPTPSPGLARARWGGKSRSICAEIGAGTAQSPAEPAGPGRLYVWWVMGLLLCINILSFVDRQMPFILAQSIKRDLKLSDTDIGLLGGLAFGLVYSTLGLPLARMGERFGR